MKNKIEKFNPKSREEELEVLLNDDKNFTNTEKYLSPLIYKIMNRYGVTEKSWKVVYNKIIHFISVSVKNYLEKHRESFKFSTYFTWWAIHIIKKELGIIEN